MSLPPPPPPEGVVASPPGSLPRPPSTAARPRPSKTWYWAAAALAAVGIVLASWGIWTGVAGFLAIGDFPRVDIPGQAEVALEPGSYTVYYETPGVAGHDEWGGDGFDDGSRVGDAGLPALDLTMEPVNGAQPVTLESRLTTSTYHVDGSRGPLEGRSVWQFHLDRAGSYLVTVSADDDTGPPAAIAIGPGIGRGIVGMVVAFFAAFWFLLAAGLVAGITALVRHSRARASRPHAPDPMLPAI